MSYNQNSENFSRYTVIDSTPLQGERSIAKNFMTSVFFWMFIGLGISALMADLFAYNESLKSMLYESTQFGIQMTGFGKIITFAPLAFVLVLWLGFSRMSSSVLTVLFVAWSAVLGMNFSSIFLIYTSGSIVGCFISAAAMFGVMAFLGYTTGKDLTSFGRILSMALIGVIIGSLINMFFFSAGFNLLLNIVSVAIFTGLTAYNMQTLKRIGAGLETEGTDSNDSYKLAILGALVLYLNFINLFLTLLELFGRRRD